jgi:hypothetical protein
MGVSKQFLPPRLHRPFWLDLAGEPVAAEKAPHRINANVYRKSCVFRHSLRACQTGKLCRLTFSPGTISGPPGCHLRGGYHTAIQCTILRPSLAYANAGPQTQAASPPEQRG